MFDDCRSVLRPRFSLFRQSHGVRCEDLHTLIFSVFHLRLWLVLSLRAPQGQKHYPASLSSGFIPAAGAGQVRVDLASPASPGWPDRRAWL